MTKTLKTLALGLGLTIGAIVTTSSPVKAGCATRGEANLGSICFTAASYCPENYVQAAGQLATIPANEALYTLLGTTYGGDGRATFGIPDLRGRAAMGAGTGPGLPEYRIGAQAGREQYVLQAENLPAHSHAFELGDSAQVTGTVAATQADGDQASPAGNVPAARPAGGPQARRTAIYGPTPDTTMASDSVALTLSEPLTTGETPNGTTQRALPMRPPQNTVMACIAVKGLYPERP